MTVDFDLIDDLSERMEQATDEERMAEVIKHFPRFKIRYQKLTQGKDKYGSYNRYQVTVTNNEQVYRYTFNDSIANTYNNTMSSDFCILHCAVLDAGCYEYNDSLQDFADNFGYDLWEDRKRAEKAFNGCKTAYESMIRLFGAEGYRTLQAIGTNY